MVKLNPKGVHSSIVKAGIVRHALIVFRASLHVLQLQQTNETTDLRRYLTETLPLLHSALDEGNYDKLGTLSNSLQFVLDGFLKQNDGVFNPIEETEGERAKRRTSKNRDISNRDSVDGTRDVQIELDENGISEGIQTRTHSRLKDYAHRFKPGKTGLSKRQKVIVFLYIIMVLAAVTAVIIVTADFIDENRDPSGLIESTSNETFLTPVVSVCLSLPGIPFSRLKLTDFIDASGKEFIGPGSKDDYNTTTLNSEFGEVVDRFWDNPRNESCDEIVGDFFPFPLRSLNQITSGEKATACRPCFRVGFQKLSYALSTAFQNSTVLNFNTDTYFIQCMKNVGGLSDSGVSFLQNAAFQNRKSMDINNVLSLNDSMGGSVSNLRLNDFRKINSRQLCNIFYFGLYPKMLNKTDDTVDIRYQYDGNQWYAIGSGPYFKIRNSTSGFLPTEALEFTVEGHDVAQENVLHRDADLILIGPNTQTFATFRRLIVFGNERYDISSSTSNLFETGVNPSFGYWLVYRVYYNYNRFVTDEWYSDSTYPVFQWLADVLGYLGLFTGVSVFSLILLPIVRALQKRDKTKLKKESPEGYVWLQHKKLLMSNPSMEEEIGEDPSETFTRSITLPGYNA